MKVIAISRFSRDINVHIKCSRCLSTMKATHRYKLATDLLLKWTLENLFINSYFALKLYINQLPFDRRRHDIYLLELK